MCQGEETSVLPSANMEPQGRCCRGFPPQRDFVVGSVLVVDRVCTQGELVDGALGRVLAAHTSPK